MNTEMTNGKIYPNREKLYRKVYDALSLADRETLLRSLTKIDTRFGFLRFEKFLRFGMQTDTAVYLCNGREFVFVPGDTVTLGWENFTVGMDDDTRLDMQEALEEYGVTDLVMFLRENMSPLRTITVSPMLVERELNDIGWRRVDLDSKELKPFREDIKKHFRPETNSFTINGKMRIYRNNGEIIAELYEPVSYSDFLARIHENGFSLPTEDEWEYLCGGGSRTLFRWGDSFDYAMKLYRFKAENEDSNAPYTLELPNQFGLSIAYDPYKQEVVEKSEYFLKGGDGGYNICGGAGIAIGYLPTATYFRSECLSKDELNYKRDIGGDYTFYRKVVRI
ncbi:MAG: formylglycine-generating enzyme family protein [Helicobacteraceae bacterium]|nr:formylglycine-generating enzyme family protein [Helicobacteraceae bacterium]